MQQITATRLGALLHGASRRAVSTMGELWRCSIDEASARRGPPRCKIDKALALSWRKATAPRAASSSSTMCDDGIGILRWWTLINCSSTLHQTGIVMSVSCQFAHNVPMTGGQPDPASSQERARASRMACVVIASPTEFHALQPKHSSRRRPRVLGRKADTVKHRGFDQMPN